MHKPRATIAISVHEKLVYLLLLIDIPFPSLLSASFGLSIQCFDSGPIRLNIFVASHTCPYQIKVTFGVSIQISEGTFSNYFALNNANIKCTPLAA